jgi:hypothetical protein
VIRHSASIIRTNCSTAARPHAPASKLRDQPIVIEQFVALGI